MLTIAGGIVLGFIALIFLEELFMILLIGIPVSIVLFVIALMVF